MFSRYFLNLLWWKIDDGSVSKAAHRQDLHIYPSSSFSPLFLTCKMGYFPYAILQTMNSESNMHAWISIAMFFKALTFCTSSLLTCNKITSSLLGDGYSSFEIFLLEISSSSSSFFPFLTIMTCRAFPDFIFCFNVLIWKSQMKADNFRWFYPNFSQLP